MAEPSLLFVNHVSTMSGAEYVLAQVTKAFPRASAFLFEQGPLAAALQSQGLQTTIARNGGQLNAIKRDKSLLHAVPAATRLGSLVLEIARAARPHNVLYANSQKAFLLTALAAHITRRPLIWHLHDILDAEHFGGAQRRIQIGLANRVATRVVVPSRACADAFVNAGGKREIVTVIPNGVARPTVTGTPDRAALGLPDGPLVGVFSRLARWKGQHVVLEAIARTPGVKLALAGSALFGEDAYERELHEQVARLGLADRVTFLGQRSDVMQLMAAVDCVVHPSIYPEPFGLTLVEAMMVGTPVIATDAGAAREILDDGAAGRLIAPDDANDLAQALGEYFAAPQNFIERTEHARRRANDYYTSERMQREVAALVQSLAADRK